MSTASTLAWKLGATNTRPSAMGAANTPATRTATASAKCTSTRLRASGRCCGRGCVRTGASRRTSCRTTLVSSSSCTTLADAGRLCSVPSSQPYLQSRPNTPEPIKSLVLLVYENERGTYLHVRDVSMTLSQLELALLGGLPLHRLDQLIASGHAPVYARPQSRRAACYTLHEAVMLATGLLLHERYSLGWPLIHHAIALNPEHFMDPLDAADGAAGFEERWLAVYDEPRSASVGRLTELPIPRVSQRVFLVSLSEAIRLVRRRANRLGLALPEPGQWSATLEAYLDQTKVQR